MKFGMDGEDGGWAWCVALSACLINFIFAGLERVAGVMYVAIIEIYNVDRKTAAIPFSVRSTTRNFLGPVVGILGQQYGVRTVTMAGGIIGTLGTASCYFADDITWISVLWGGLCGVGTALTTTLPQVIIGQYFKKHRTTASGLAFSGGCVGSVLFPILIEYSIRNYGLQATFLVLSGVIVNSIPAAMILRKPSWIKEKNKQLQTVNNDETKNSTDKVPQPTLPIEKPSAKFYWFHRDINLVSKVAATAMQVPNSDNADLGTESSKIEQAVERDSPIVLLLLSDMFSVALQQLGLDSNEIGMNNINFGSDEGDSDNVKCKFHQWLNELQSYSFEKEFDAKPDETVRGILIEIKEVYGLCLEAVSCPKTVAEVVIDVEPQINKSVEKTEKASKANTECQTNSVIVKEDNLEQEKSSGFKEHILNAIMLYANPIFLLISLCRTVHFITFIPVLTILVDFGMDKGLLEEDGKYLIAALSAGDLMGRLGLGWITDKGFLGLQRYMFCSMVIQGCITATFPLMTSKWSLLLILTLFGVLQGSMFIRHPVLVQKYISCKETSIAMGSINLLSGVVGFAIPDIIGYFRDTLGSYDNLFYINGVVVISVGVLWLFEPQLVQRSSCYRKKIKRETTTPSS